ncbi:hypothetical protein ACWGKS_29925 [Nocardiopsis sp. NPDC055879]
MNRCTLTRWHPFKAGADLPKNCVKPAGHAGMCRDYRGDYEGSPGRTREMTPEEVDAHNLSDAECTSSRCILPSGHTGVHTEHAEPFVVSACVAQLAGLLATPGLPRDAAETLAKAATVWETLDTLLSTGGTLPSRWVSPRVDPLLSGIDTTPLHSALTESLDTTPPGGGYRVMPFTTLRAAVHTWEALDTVLRAGAALPEPWEVAR